MIFNAAVWLFLVEASGSLIIKRGCFNEQTTGIYLRIMNRRQMNKIIFFSIHFSFFTIVSNVSKVEATSFEYF